MPINRERKSSFERKCVSKATKRLFGSDSREVRKIMDKVEKDSWKLEYAVMNYDVKIKTSR